MTKSSKTVFIIVLIGIAMLGLLLWRFPYVLNSDDHLANIIRCVLLLCVLIPGAIHHFGSAPALKYGAIWMGVFLVLLVGYSFHEELGFVANRVKSNVLPFSGVQHENGSVSFMRAKDGHFQIEALVNNIPVQFMVDTGATKIALSKADAKRLGIDVANLSYNEPIHTANGLTFGALIQLAELKIGNIVVHDISASVTQNLDGLSLLGMSFLERLKGFKIEGEHLTFEAPTS